MFTVGVASNYDDDFLVSVWGIIPSTREADQKRYRNTQFYNVVTDTWSEGTNNIPLDFASLFIPRGLWLRNTQYLLFTGGQDMFATDDANRVSNQVLLYNFFLLKFYL